MARRFRDAHAAVETRRAFLELVEGKPEAAREAAGRASQEFPAAAAYIEGVLSYGNQEYSRALPQFRKAFEGLQGRSPHALPYIHFYLGDSLARESRSIENEPARTGLRREAERHLLAELSLNPTNSDAATSLCSLHALEGEVRKVHEVLGDFARGNPSVATYELVSHLYGAMKLDGDAARWAERARSMGRR